MNASMNAACGYPHRNRSALAGALLAIAALTMAGCADQFDSVATPIDPGTLPVDPGTPPVDPVATVFGIRGGAELVRFSPDSPAIVASIGTISGLGAG